mmetsp:Transcript_16849/g.54932  ORF Transcript_16849/g.54932 Transcript_16849/m.54932 type:complete len:219 (+) Transcript_16849:2-658(+)
MADVWAPLASRSPAMAVRRSKHVRLAARRAVSDELQSTVSAQTPSWRTSPVSWTVRATAMADTAPQASADAQLSALPKQRWRIARQPLAATPAWPGWRVSVPTMAASAPASPAAALRSGALKSCVESASRKLSQTPASAFSNNFSALSRSKSKGFDGPPSGSGPTTVRVGARAMVFAASTADSASRRALAAAEAFFAASQAGAIASSSLSTMSISNFE